MAHAPAVLAEPARLSIELRRNDQSEVMRHLAHDLRQPLGTIESIACYLELVLSPEHKAFPHVVKLRELVEQAGTMLSDAVHILQVAPLRREPVDLNELVAEAAERFPLECQPLPTLRLDPAQIRHMLYNLCTVLPGMSYDEGSVAIRTFAETGWAGIELTLAIDEAVRRTICDLLAPFGAELRDGAGFPLLAIRKIVDAHGGRLQIGDTSDGGMALRVRFPAG